MELIQEIGSYAGLAAILGLAVLSALYFSQARDVRRLREWAGRAPERISEPAAQPAQVVARPVPRPPGAQGTQPGLRPPGAPAAASAAGAGPALVRGPPAATPAAARAVGAPAGQNPGEGVSEDTMSHPPPSHDDGDAPEAAEHPDDRHTDDSPAAVEDYEPDDEEPASHEGDDREPTEEEREDAGDDHPLPPPEGHWERDEQSHDDTADSPVLGPSPPATGGPPRPVPPPPPPWPAPLPARSAPATSAGARSAGVPVPPRRPVAPSRPPADPVILPPYERSRPGGDPWYQSLFYSRGRAALVIGLSVLIIATATLAGLMLAGGDDETASPDPRQAGAGPTADSGGGGRPGAQPAVDPADVTVSVLNGTTVSGLASRVGDSVEAEGYQLGVVTNDPDQTRAESVVFYADGAEEEAEDVSRRLDIPQREPIDAETQALAGDASVVVVVGADKS